MRAAVVHDFQHAPKYGTFELPSPGDDVVVDVLAAALSPRVRSAASGSHYTSDGKLPLVPGIDGVGRLADGRRAYFIAANDTVGAMAERAIAHARLLAPLPDGLSSSEIAAGMLPAISSWVALTKRAALKPGQTVLVLGATGTSGQLAVQVARRLGAGRVIAVGRGKAIGQVGADEVVRLQGNDDDAKNVAAVAGEVDIVLDYLWGTVTSALLPAMCRERKDETRALTWVLIGAVAGDEISLSSVLLRKRNLTVLGSGQGASSVKDMFGCAPDIIAAFAEKQLSVHVREAPLAELETLWNAKLASGERLVFVP